MYTNPSTDLKEPIDTSDKLIDNLSKPIDNLYKPSDKPQRANRNIVKYSEI